MYDGERASPDRSERRQNPRVKISVPVELESEGSTSPMRGATSDLSLSGCYIETLYPFPVGTLLDLKLQIEDSTLLVAATVVTCDPQVGNGIRFNRMLPEDREALNTYLEAVRLAQNSDPKPGAG